MVDNLSPQLALEQGSISLTPRFVVFTAPYLDRFGMAAYLSVPPLVRFLLLALTFPYASIQVLTHEVARLLLILEMLEPEVVLELIDYMLHIR